MVVNTKFEDRDEDGVDREKRKEEFDDSGEHGNK